MSNNNENKDTINISSTSNINIFGTLKQVIIDKKETIWEQEKLLRKMKQELKNEVELLQSLCNHNYIRECATSGCYAEYHYICKNCQKIR